MQLGFPRWSAVVDHRALAGPSEAEQFVLAGRAGAVQFDPAGPTEAERFVLCGVALLAEILPYISQIPG